ncbi:hypothetical protein GOP47_0023522 [Adiantum capillus-veneris]|uniref:GRIP domain-containing protein n=1 Tax=Adiantum capillus-veneris TaxID=13818 RepID=A0A9D4U4P4_ADICA|nr:hypothetical protein GOP47_0023522 [Adiantum capillus-veneris]
MWSTIENFRESLSQITSEVLDAAEELEGGGSEHPSSAPNTGSDASSHRRLRQLPLTCQGEGDNGVTSKQNGKENHVLPPASLSNGFLPKLKELQVHNRKLQAREKDLLKELSEKNLALASLQEAHGKTLEELGMLKESSIKEREELSSVKTQLHRERKLVEEANRENKRLKLEKQKMSLETTGLQHRLVEQSVEINKMKESARAEIQKEMDSILIMKDEKAEQLQGLVHEMEEKLLQLQAEVNALRQRQNSGQFLSFKEIKAVDRPEEKSSEMNNDSKQVTDAAKAVRDAFELESKNYEKKLAAACAERDKAVRDLKRLKQHLLEKEQADSEKMEQDSQHICELEEKADVSMVRAMRLEQNLAQTLQKQAEVNKRFNERLEEANQEIASLRKKLAACLNASESKDSELQNLQAALGQYYAEGEAKDRIQTELSAARKELDRLLEQLKSANNAIMVKDGEKGELLEKLALQQKKVSESQEQSHKLEADVLMLRRALEQSLTRLNRMSSDSDYYVDRRIVIKLLVTYFQRQQSREVLDLMSRMLGFSEEDKQVIGLAQQSSSKGVVRGVLGLPGRVVGGLLKTGSSPSVMSLSQTDNQSFSDLWIDFLLKESEEREKRDALAAEASTSQDSNPSSTPDPKRLQNTRNDEHLNGSPFSTPNASAFENGPSSRYHGNDSPGSEFSNVPLNSSPSPSLARSYLQRQT